MNCAIQRNEATRSIIEKISGLNLSTYEYVLSKSDRSEEQWMNIYHNIIRDVNNLSSELKGDYEFQNIENELTKVLPLFNKIRSNNAEFELFSENENLIKQEKDLSSRLLLSLQTILGYSRVIGSRIEESIEKLRFEFYLTSILISLVFSLIIILLVFFIIRPIVKRLNRISEQTEKIETGNSNLRIKDNYSDEIGFFVSVLNKKLDTISFQSEKMQKEIERRKFSEKRLQELTKVLKESNSELESFAYIASHDLQEPLRKINVYSNFLAEEERAQLSEDGVMYISTIQKAVNRMTALINNLLEYSRVSTKERVLKRIELPLVFNEILEDLEILINKTNTVVLIQDLPIIMADYFQIKQLFQNFVSNAIKYRKPDLAPEILISFEKNDQEVSVIIEDNGIGIEETFWKIIFEPFKRLHSRSEIPGSGIGLSICKKIVELYNGNIKVKSVPGQGCTFYISFPLEMLLD